MCYDNTDSDILESLMHMKRLFTIFLTTLLLLCGCSDAAAPAEIAATTLPVWEFTSRICEGTPLTVTRLVTEEVSCLHDYSLNVRQVKAAEAADLIVISGAGLEEFMEDILHNKNTIDASLGIDLLIPEEHHHEEEANHEEHEGHDHQQDPHIWLSPINASVMSKNIYAGLACQYPQYQAIFEENLSLLQQELEALNQYGSERLETLSCRDLVTFHDGFSYLAECYDLHILEAVEEESGSEASAQELINLIKLAEAHNVPAVFTEVNGSSAGANFLSAQTGASVYTLSMAMSGDDYFTAMYHNIDTIREALG